MAVRWSSRGHRPSASSSAVSKSPTVCGWNGRPSTKKVGVPDDAQVDPVVEVALHQGGHLGGRVVGVVLRRVETEVLGERAEQVVAAARGPRPTRPGSRTSARTSPPAAPAAPPTPRLGRRARSSRARASGRGSRSVTRPAYFSRRSSTNGYAARQPSHSKSRNSTKVTPLSPSSPRTRLSSRIRLDRRGCRSRPDRGRRRAPDRSRTPTPAPPRSRPGTANAAFVCVRLVLAPRVQRTTTNSSNGPGTPGRAAALASHRRMTMKTLAPMSMRSWSTRTTSRSPRRSSAPSVSPARRQILVHLHLGPHRVTDQVAHLDRRGRRSSQHLACLRDCGLVESVRQGRASFHSLVPGVPIDALLEAAGAVTSVAVRAEGH